LQPPLFGSTPSPKRRIANPPQITNLPHEDS
jgi:hypothetical protein